MWTFYEFPTSVSEIASPMHRQTQNEVDELIYL